MVVATNAIIFLAKPTGLANTATPVTDECSVKVKANEITVASKATAANSGFSVSAATLATKPAIGVIVPHYVMGFIY